MRQREEVESLASASKHEDRPRSDTCTLCVEFGS